MLNFLNTVRRSDNKGHVGSNIVGKSIVSLKRKTSFYINLYFSSFHSAHPPLSFCWGVKPPTKFSKKRGGSTGPKFFEGAAGKEEVTFFTGVAVFT